MLPSSAPACGGGPAWAKPGTWLQVVGALVAADMGAVVADTVAVVLPVSAPLALAELAQPAMDAITKNETSASDASVISPGLHDGQR